MTRFKLLRVVVIVSMSIATQAQAYGTGGREVAALPWSVTCMTGHDLNALGEHSSVSGACAGYSGKKNALSPKVDAPHRHDGDKMRVDWPANMILG